METISLFVFMSPHHYIRRETFWDKRYENYILLKMDYIGFYLPKIWLYKFEYLRILMENPSSSIRIPRESLISLGDHLEMIDLTEDFIRLCNLKHMEFDEFIRNFYWIANNSLLMTNRNHIKCFYHFLDFLGLDPVLMNAYQQDHESQ